MSDQHCQAVGCRELASPIPLGVSLPAESSEDGNASRVNVELRLCPVHLAESAAGLRHGYYGASLWDGGGPTSRLELEFRASRGDEWAASLLARDQVTT